jgi:hypothetical protein
MTLPEQTVVYDHTQVSHVTVALLGGLLMAELGLWFALYQLGALDGPTMVFMVGLIALLIWIILIMRRLRVQVNPVAVQVTFGTGWPQRMIPLAEIASCQAVRLSPWTGYGMRYIGRGWMFNIEGRDAVELALKNGSRFRIGTDEPAQLVQALQPLLT